MTRVEVSCIQVSQKCRQQWRRCGCQVEVSGVNSKDGGVMCAWVTKVSAAMVEVEVTGDDGKHEVSSVMAEVEVSCEVVSMAAVGKVPWRC